MEKKIMNGTANAVLCTAALVAHGPATPSAPCG